MLPDAIQQLRQRARQPVILRESALLADRAELDELRTDQALQVLSALGGVLASLLFVLFFWSVGLLADPLVSVVTGSVFVVVTILLGRSRRQAFLAALTVTGYVLGTVLIMIGLPASAGEAFPVVPVAIIAAATLFFSLNYYLVLLAAGSLPLCLVYLHLVWENAGWTWAALLLTCAALTYLSFYEYRHVHDRRLRPARSGLAIGLTLTLLWYRWAGYFTGEHAGTYTVIPLFAGCIFLLLMSFRNRHLLGLGLAVAGLAYFTAQYYYDLRWDLLDKSLVLLVTGSVLLGAYVWLHRKNLRRRA